MGILESTANQKSLADEIIAQLKPSLDQDQLNRLTFLLKVSFRRRRILRTIAAELAEAETQFGIFLDEREAAQAMTINWERIREIIIEYGPLILQIIMLFL